MFGLTRGTTRAHVARATLEAITFRVRQVIDAMGSEGTRVAELHVDGGAAANDLLLQLQADILGVPVTRPKNIETTGLGAAHLAALGAGLHDSLDDVATAWAVDRVFEPRTNTDLEERFARFERGVTLVRELAHPSTALRNSEIFGVS
jgi:glycerol kinase